MKQIEELVAQAIREALDPFQPVEARDPMARSKMHWGGIAFGALLTAIVAVFLVR